MSIVKLMSNVFACYAAASSGVATESVSDCELMPRLSM